MKNYSRISVIGMGYIGLPTAALFASRKMKVIGVDISKSVVDTINRGEIHIVEPGLDMVVRASVTEGYLAATTHPEPADAFLIAVPTPFKGDNHAPDLNFIHAAAKAIAPVLVPGNLIVLESTSPVGTTEKMAAWLAEERPDLSMPQTHGETSDIRIAYCPERVLPGNVMRELVENDRVIGGMTDACSRDAIALYKTIVLGECVVTDARTAEMAKLTENSFRDVNIAFANELSIVCDELDINVWELIALANRHPRVNILQPGPGVGGHCIAVDPWFIVSQNPKSARIIRTAREINDAKPSWVIDKTEAAIKAFLAKNPGKKIDEIILACYGLAFKPNIDDLRESPSLDIALHLSTTKACRTLIVEPNIQTLPDSLTNSELVSVEEAMVQADIHLLLVAHNEFATVTVPEGIIVDVTGLWTGQARREGAMK